LTNDVFLTNDAFRILHHSATDGVTGSCHELRLAEGAGILIDCGMFQGEECSTGGASEEYPEIEFSVAHIKALVVTHVHLDHVGRIPYLLAAGFEGPIYCSEPSAVLLPLVLEDAIKVGVTRDSRLLDNFLTRLKALISPVPYGKWQGVDTGTATQLSIKLQPAGHILGSAYVECRIRHLSSVSCHLFEDHNRYSFPVTCHLEKTKDQQPMTNDTAAIADVDYVHLSNDPAVSVAVTNDQGPVTKDKVGYATLRDLRVVFSGDLGAPYAPLLPAPRSPWRADVLVLESTYGDRLHEGRRERRTRLQGIIEAALENRGVVLVPAFSIGRTQELLYELEDIIHRNSTRFVTSGVPWEDLEIIVDSPLANRFTEVYRELGAFWDKEACRRVRAGRHPLSFEQLTTIDEHEDHLAAVDYLKRNGRPCVVIAASGMCSGGRIVNYLKALLGDARTDVLFVGYQAMGTPGRDIQQYGPGGGYVVLDGKRYDIRARIHTLSGYSAHADQRNLVDFVRRMRCIPKEVRLVHGEVEARQSLAAALQEELGESVIVRV
jgi:metallo-beta-lactamase family protein